MKTDAESLVARHTPGPWAVDPRGCPSIWAESVGGVFLTPARHKVADVRGWGHLQYREDGEAVQDANARLIAAAPELLAALVAMLHTEWVQTPGSPGEWEIRADVLEAARAAIRKASGEAA